MKYIFLDIDGVMDNSSDRIANNISDFRPYISDRTLSLLKYLLEKTDAEIVLTSELRRDINFKRYFWACLEDYDIATSWNYETRYIPSGNKSDEINEFLGNRAYIDAFVVLDDACLEVENLVRVDASGGLQQKDVDEAIKILNA